MVYGCSGETNGTVSDEMTQWYLDAMNIERNAQDASSKKVEVELLDSGVSYISALKDVNRIDLVSDEGAENTKGFSDTLFNDNSGHGTAMAGLIAANAPDGSLTGINPDADLYSVRILDESLQAPVSKVVEGIYWGIENHVDIINMSFGTEVNSEALHSAVKAAADAGILMVAAAGNNSGKGILYPAAYPEVIAVGATTSDGTILSGSATGSELELLAPGSQIISTGMVDGYTAGSGTSLATAEVTGIASLLLGQPGATADMVRGLLRITAKDMEGTDAGLVDYGYAKEHFGEYLVAYQNNEVDENVFENPAALETYDTEGIVNGLWKPDTHNDLVYDAGILNSTYVTIASYAAKIADNQAYHPRDTTIYNALHGMGAYPMNLYAIWKYANFTNKGDSDAINKAWDSLTAAQKGALGVVEPGTNFTAKNMLSACELLLQNEKNKYSKNAQKKYLIVGFGCHMIGDIYAHRTLVPKYVFYSGNTQENIDANNAGYKSRLDRAHFKDWNGLMNAFNEGRLTFPKLETYAYDNITSFSTKYEDNTGFCKERLDAALACTKEFLSKISSATDNKATVEIIKGKKYVSLIHYDEYMSYF